MAVCNIETLNQKNLKLDSEHHNLVDEVRQKSQEVASLKATLDNARKTAAETIRQKTDSLKLREQELTKLQIKYNEQVNLMNETQ